MATDSMLLSANIQNLKFEGDLKERKHFARLFIDNNVVATSAAVTPRASALEWKWNQGQQIWFTPSSKIKVELHRYHRFKYLPSSKPLVGVYEGELVDLLENNATFNLKDKKGDGMSVKMSMLVSRISWPEGELKNFLGALDSEVLRLADKEPGSISSILGTVLEAAKPVFDNLSQVHPIAQASWTVLSYVYKAVKDRSIQNDEIHYLAQDLREMLATARAVPDIQNVPDSVDLPKEIGRLSLQAASYIHHHALQSRTRQVLTIQVSNLRDKIRDCRNNCSALQGRVDRRIAITTNNNVTEIRQQVEMIREDGLADKIKTWLSPPDSSRNWNEGLNKRFGGTCTWFLESEKFSAWKKDAGFLWIKGKAGSGKSILCSSVLETLAKESHHYMAYFFFDGRDAQTEQQHHHKLLRSLISLISHDSNQQTVPRPLVDLYNKAKARQPLDKELEETLAAIVRGLPEVYIVIDALDECRAEDREFTLRWLADIATHKHQNLHILVTSRPEHDIVEAFNHISLVSVDTTNEDGPDQDIMKYLEKQLASNKFRKYDQDTQSTIKSKLVEGAEGSFRWAALQIAELEKCASVHEIIQQLTMLPRGLDEIYRRILKAIDPKHYNDVKTILQFLAFSFQPLSLEEVAEAITVDLMGEDGPVYRPERRYQEPQEILRRCSSLVTETDGFIKLSHFSVKEFLLSDLSSAPKDFRLHEKESHWKIADISVAYLLQYQSEAAPTEIRCVASSFAKYAAHFWIHHTQKGTAGEIKIAFSNVIKLLTCTNAFFNWVCIWDIDNDGWHQHSIFAEDKIGSAVYYACLTGKKQILEGILEKEGMDINEEGGRYGFPLQAASYGGHLELVMLLLEKGADVDAKGGRYGNALQAASSEGHLEIVKLLLEKAAEVDAKGKHYGNALQAASYRGHLEIVKLLLEKGAEVDAKGSYLTGNVLQAASRRGHLEIVRLLLEKGAEVDAMGFHENALQAASEEGHLEIVKLLLEKGADVDAKGGDYGNALQAASIEGHLEIVKLLLEKGAEVDAKGKHYGNTLQAASYRGHLEIVRLLLEKGAEVDVMGFHRNALQAASEEGHLEIVKLLLEKEADVDAKGGDYGNPLQAASCRGHLEIVKLLLEKGAEVDAKGGDYGNALLAASYQGHPEIVKLLLEKEADVGAKGGDYGNALQAASQEGHLEIVKLLLEKATEVDAKGGHFGDALQAASIEGHLEIVKLLLEKAAEVDAKGKHYGNALQAASQEGHLEIVKLLLEKGAEVDAQGGVYGNALQAASDGGHPEIVKLLLEKEADVDAKGGHYGNALQAASLRGNLEIVKLLLESGADVNAHGGKYGTALQVALSNGHREVQQLLVEHGAMEDLEILMKYFDTLT